MTLPVVPASGSAAAPAAAPAAPAAPAFSGLILTVVKNWIFTTANQAGSSARSAVQYAQTRAEEAFEQALPVVQAKANEALDFFARSCGKRRRNDDLADAVLEYHDKILLEIQNAEERDRKLAEFTALIDVQALRDSKKQRVDQGQGSKDADKPATDIEPEVAKIEQKVAAIEQEVADIEQEVADIEQKVAAIKRDIEHDDLCKAYALRPAVPLPAHQIQADLALMRAMEQNVFAP